MRTHHYSIHEHAHMRVCSLLCTVWVATQQLESLVAFLPVNPTLSALRNQARQKLATLDKNTFSQLVVDVLNECYCRQQKSMRSGGWWVGQGGRGRSGVSQMR